MYGERRIVDSLKYYARITERVLRNTIRRAGPVVLALCLSAPIGQGCEGDAIREGKPDLPTVSPKEAVTVVVPKNPEYPLVPAGTPGPVRR